MSSKITDGKLTAWERWELASFDAPTGAIQDDAETEPAITLAVAEEIERRYQQAKESGHAEGHAAGYASGYGEGQVVARAESTRLAELSTKLDSAMTQFDQRVAPDLLELALDVARQVIRQALAVKPELVLEVVKETLSQMPHVHVTIQLHPEDASLVRSYMGDQLSHAGHRIHEDRRLARGDCLLESGGSLLDATLATRWRRTVENLGSNAEWLQPSTAETLIEESPENKEPPARLPESDDASAEMKNTGIPK
ncbi:MAG: flagellar assembly protein FliH [Proteobacteria bacterium]|nr:flagellar assembly protein FliH [Pseudomonadota bacterium]